MHCARPLPWLAMDGRTNVILFKKEKGDIPAFYSTGQTHN